MSDDKDDSVSPTKVIIPTMLPFSEDENSIVIPIPKKKPKETNLTVKPLRLQLEEPTHTLQKTLNISIESSEVIPLETQIAGHGSCNDGKRGLLRHGSGLVLKPVQAPPKGRREVAFYQKLSTSSNETDIQFKSLTAKYFGTKSVTLSSGDVIEYLVLENLTQRMTKPCVMDVKIGAITYGPDASNAKREKEAKSYSGTKIPLGFSVLGIISYPQNEMRRLTKAFGQSLQKDSINQVLENFLCLDSHLAKLISLVFIEKLEGFLELFTKQTTYHMYASSLLFVYDYDKLNSKLFDIKDFITLKLIDFAHVFPAKGKIDENFVNGLENILNMFKAFVEKKSD